MNALTFQEEASKLERLLYRISWSMLSNNEDCADAVQETLYKAWQGRGSLKNIKAFRSWITRILVNTCNDMLRQRKRQRWVPLEEDMAVLQPPEENDFPMDEALGRLSPEHRTVVVLYYLEGY
ncbi:MAG: RNA polymerase sigma factor, partial [Eubacteriales bacterium]|nr:RNA polymerase sigma factor [Eubacteriales bacterium]